MDSFFLEIKFPSLNDYINAERRHRMLGAKMKKDYTDLVIQLVKIKKVKKYTHPVSISFEWHEENAKRDPDNIIFAKKFILDGFVKAGILLNDTQKNILAFDDTWVVTPGKPGVQVSIAEYEDE